jgi:hypothetical protein
MRKTVSNELRFGIEMGIGLITFIAVLLLGEAGFAFFSIYAITAFLKAKKLDEREIQLFHKANTGTLGSVFLSMFLVYHLLPSFNWLIALACSLLFFHGFWNLLTRKSG